MTGNDGDGDTQPERVFYSDKREGPPDVRILHFNDVYHPGPREEEPQGGAPRFQTLCNYYRHDDQFKDMSKPLTLFSGDAFNPSRESTVTKGSHMVPVLNKIGIDVACVGNHEFDFGAAHFAYLSKECEFPWLLANIYDPDLGENSPMGGCKRYKIVETSNGIKVGIIGLVEKEWTEKINNSLPSDLEYYDMKEVAKELAPKVREEGAEIVVCLTHARQARDFDFCENIPEGLVDIVLGGHDHWAEHHKFDNGTHFVRSGFDFQNLTYTQAWRKKDGKGWDFEIVRRNLVSDLEEDQEMKKIGDEQIERVHKLLEQRVGYTAAPLDARDDVVKTQESNWANFVCDLMRLYHSTDCAILNGGTVFADKVYSTGELKLKDIVDCFPFEDPIVVVKVTGKAVKEALENGVSKYPEKDSRFPQVSNIRFSFDPNASPMSRVKKITVAGEDLDPKKEYTVATRAHIASGKVGYESLKGKSDGGEAEEVIDDENGILISSLLRQYFSSLQVIGHFRPLSGDHKSHWEGILDNLGPTAEERKKTLMRRVWRKWRRLSGHGDFTEQAIKDGEGEFFEGWTKGIQPRFDGRIEVVSK